MSEIGDYSEGNMSAAGAANVFHDPEADGYKLNTKEIPKNKKDDSVLVDAFGYALRGIV